MKRKITLSIALALSVALVSLMSSDSKANAAPQRIFVADTGVITVGPNQTLRITVANGLDTATVSFRRLEYTEGTCDGGVCKHMISSQTVSDPISLAPGEAASTNFGGDTATHEFRGVVVSNLRNVQVTSLLIDNNSNTVQAMAQMNMQ